MGIFGTVVMVDSIAMIAATAKYCGFHKMTTIADFLCFCGGHRNRSENTESRLFSTFCFCRTKIQGGCDQESNYPRNKALIVVVVVLLIFVDRKVKINLNFLWQINYI